MFGLSFLNSLYLWGLAAASIPLIIHLIKRNRAVKLPFAAMRFLQIEPHQTVRSHRLKQILLLLMRVTVLAFLAMAFARPFLKEATTTTIWSDQPKSVVILVDNSFSMGYESHFQKAVEKVKELLKTFKAGDRVTVVQFSESAEIVGEADDEFTTLGSLLSDRLRLSNRSTNFLQGLQTAEAILQESSFEDKSIYLISDFQKSGWVENYFHWKIQPGVKLNFIPIKEEDITNFAIAEVRIGGDEGRRRKRDVLVRVHNYSHKVSGIKVLLHLNEKKVAERKTTVPPEGDKIVQFKKVTFSSLSTPGFVEIQTDGDKMVLDNYLYFVFDKKLVTKILGVNGEPNHRDLTQDELFFIERAVNFPNAAKYKLIKSSQANLSKQEFSEYRAVILANVKDLGRDDLERLSFYVRGGGGLILALGDRVNPTIFNRLFRDLTPAQLIDLAFNSLNRENGAILAEVDYQHSIFRPFSDPGHGDLSTAQFYQYFQVKPLNSEFVLARFDDGNPAILERKVGMGKVVLFTSSLDTEWNNLPVKAIFLPLLYQTIQYIGAEKKEQKSFLVGQPVALRTGPRPKFKNDKIFIQVPSGEKVEVQSNFFDKTKEPGIYQIYRGNQKKVTDYFAVNIESKESDLTALDPEELKDKFVEESEENIQKASLTSDNINDQLEKRQKLWRFIILSVILLLVGETWLANRTYR